MARRPEWIFIALLLAAAASVSATETLVENEPAETKPQDFVYVAATNSDSIGRIMTPVFVNGVGPFAFMVDTGASSSVIAPRVARRLSLVPNLSSTKLLRGITGSEEVPTVLVDSIT